MDAQRRSLPAAAAGPRPGAEPRPRHHAEPRAHRSRTHRPRGRRERCGVGGRHAAHTQETFPDAGREFGRATLRSPSPPTPTRTKISARVVSIASAADFYRKAPTSRVPNATNPAPSPSSFGSRQAPAQQLLAAAGRAAAPGSHRTPSAGGPGARHRTEQSAPTREPGAEPPRLRSAAGRLPGVPRGSEPDPAAHTPNRSGVPNPSEPPVPQPCAHGARSRSPAQPRAARRGAPSGRPPPADGRDPGAIPPRGAQSAAPLPLPVLTGVPRGGGGGAVPAAPGNNGGEPRPGRERSPAAAALTAAAPWRTPAPRWRREALPGGAVRPDGRRSALPAPPRPRRALPPPD